MVQEEQNKTVSLSYDVFENDIRTSMPRILEILLLERTTSSPNTPKNIIWANDNYKKYNAASYLATAQITPELITGKRDSLILPRAMKTRRVSQYFC